MPRWSFSNTWLAGDTVWVIGITKQIKAGNTYQHGVIGKSIHSLAETFASNQTMRFGLINYERDECLKETLIQNHEPGVVLIKNGTVYRQDKMRESYSQMIEFINRGYIKAPN